VTVLALRGFSVAGFFQPHIEVVRQTALLVVENIDVVMCADRAAATSAASCQVAAIV
jgi:hypothetical protein